jgi:intraflagellar transport protein 88
VVQVNQMIEESAAAAEAGDNLVALDKVGRRIGTQRRVLTVDIDAQAKEAVKRERLLCRHREKAGLAEQINFDLTYAATFNLATQ